MTGAAPPVGKGGVMVPVPDVNVPEPLYVGMDMSSASKRAIMQRMALREKARSRVSLASRAQVAMKSHAIYLGMHSIASGSIRMSRNARLIAGSFHLRSRRYPATACPLICMDDPTHQQCVATDRTGARDPSQQLDAPKPLARAARVGRSCRHIA